MTDINYLDFTKKRGVCLCDIEDCYGWCCCGHWWLCCAPYMGYKNGYQEQCIDILTDIKLEHFWKKKEIDNLKKADALATERISEVNKLYSGNVGNMLHSFNSTQQSSFKEKQPSASGYADERQCHPSNVLMR